MAESLVTPTWLDTGDNAWQLTAASLVGLQSVPGLMLLYGGIVKTKWAINSAFMAFYAFAMVLICWVLWAYKMAFGIYMLPFVGRPGPVVAMKWELQQSTLPSAGVSQNFPISTMIYFQFVFAAITLVIMAGAFLGRMNFKAWMLFVPLWLTFSYTIGAYSLWGGGFLFKRGVLDYSGGYVIHLSSGTAGWVGAWWIGPRHPSDRNNFKPNNILMTLAGAGILWIGWNGFNGGDPYSASPDAGVAVLNTNICTAFSLLTWTLCDIIYFGKPSVIGAVQGMITGLVGITPAAGFVAGWGAIIIGATTGSVPWLSMNLLGKTKFMESIDDTLGVFHTHMVAGFIGGMFTGLFATAPGVLAFGDTNNGGAIDDNGRQVWLQLVGALFIIGWNVVWTSLIMMFIKFVCRIPLRMSEEELLLGDEFTHGEEAYTFECHGHRSLLNGDYQRRADHGDGETGVTMGRDPHEDAIRDDSSGSHLKKVGGNGAEKHD